MYGHFISGVVKSVEHPKWTLFTIDNAKHWMYISVNAVGFVNSWDRLRKNSRIIPSLKYVLKTQVKFNDSLLFELKNIRMFNGNNLMLNFFH